MEVINDIGSTADPKNRCYPMAVRVESMRSLEMCSYFRFKHRARCQITTCALATILGI